MDAVTITIAGMSCDHCVASVKRALSSLDGVAVREVTVGSASVEFDPLAVSPRELIAAIESKGFAAQLAG